MVPHVGIKPTTFCLQDRCSITELVGQKPSFATVMLAHWELVGQKPSFATVMLAHWELVGQKPSFATVMLAHWELVGLG